MEDNKTKKIEELAISTLNMARNTLVINLRFMDKAISMLKCKSTPDVDSIAVDGSNIYYNPVYVLKTFTKEKSRVARQYLHMILHCVYHHFWVSTLVQQDYWDLACDIAVEFTINDIAISSLNTQNASKQTVEFRKLRDKVKYMTADVLYKYFVTEKLAEDEVQRLRKIFSSDDHSLWYSRKVREKLASGNVSAGKTKVQLNIMVQDGNMDDSNSQESRQLSGSQQAIIYSKADIGKLLDEWKAVARQMKMDIEIFSKQRGLQAGGLTQNLLAVTREKYDYSSFLRKFAVLGERMKINDDEFDYIFYTYGMQLYKKMPLIEPLEYKDVKQIKEFVVAIDTSGSTSGELVQTFLRKTYNILKEEESFFTRFNLHIVQCDATIQEDVKITNQQEFDAYISTMKIRGLGGTDFRPVFSYVDKLIEEKEFTNLKGLIYFTDGFGEFPKKQPDYDVAFIYIDEGYENPQVPVWAMKLVLQPDDIKEI